MALPAELQRRRFTAEEYHRMAQTGILTADDHVELVEGEIVHMTPIGQRHAACVAVLTRLFVQAVRERAVVWPQNPLRLSSDTELQPDLALLRPRDDEYRNQVATSSDTLLVVEVADASHRYDRLVKVPVYARTGAPEVWLVDIPAGTIEVYREPVGRAYERVTRHAQGDTVAPRLLPDVRSSVEEILGPPAHRF